jgi:DNA-binding MarR family transcriptional regulator
VLPEGGWHARCFGKRSVNAHFFGTKRAFHGILRVMRRPLASFGLTAARYDMLYAIDRSGSQTHQKELSNKLGVHKSVVSRMLRSLEQLGLVERHRSRDGRQRIARLTDAGLGRLRDAARCLARASTRLLCMAICFGRKRDPDERFRHMCVYESYLDAIRQLFGDTARRWYPWHPDD